MLLYHMFLKMQVTETFFPDGKSSDELRITDVNSHVALFNGRRLDLDADSFRWQDFHANHTHPVRIYLITTVSNNSYYVQW